MNDQATLTRNCAEPDCGLPFVMHHIDAKYCSLRCKQRAAHKRRRLRDAGQPRQAPRQYAEEKIVPLPRSLTVSPAVLEREAATANAIKQWADSYRQEHGQLPPIDLYMEKSEEIKASIPQESELAIRDVLDPDWKAKAQESSDA